MIVNNIQPAEDILNRFDLLHQRARLAHAYLFVGPQGIGKGETALGVAKLINCEMTDSHESFCNKCSNCLKIEAGNHPDIHVIEGGVGESIKIDQIRALLAQVKLRPFQADRKVFIIRNIENLTLESSHALLKTLEEPTANSLLLLTVSVKEKVLSTIRSRCHGIPFLPPSREILVNRLIKDYAETQEEAHFLAYFAEGCLGKAQKLKKNKIGAQTHEVIDRFILAGESEDFLKKILADKIKTKGFLDILLSWMRDSLLMKAGVEDHRLIHIGRLNDLRKFTKRFSFEEIRDLYDEGVKTTRLFMDNLNVKISLLIIKEKLLLHSH